MKGENGQPRNPLLSSPESHLLLVTASAVLTLELLKLRLRLCILHQDKTIKGSCVYVIYHCIFPVLNIVQNPTVLITPN